MGGRVVNPGDLADIATGPEQENPDAKKNVATRAAEAINDATKKLKVAVDRKDGPSVKATIGVINVQASNKGVAVTPNLKNSERKPEPPVKKMPTDTPIQGRGDLDKKIEEVIDIVKSKPYVRAEASATVGKGVLQQSQSIYHVGEGSGDYRDGWLGVLKMKFLGFFKIGAEVQVKNVVESGVEAAAAGVAKAVNSMEVTKTLDPEERRKRISEKTGGEVD